MKNQFPEHRSPRSQVDEETTTDRTAIPHGSHNQSTEWRTVLLAIGLYGSWVLALLSSNMIPVPISLVLVSLTITWHGSLQHEVVHGHPFRDQQLNRTLATPPLGMRVPFLVYKRDHLIHHRVTDLNQLTDPQLDTESYYLYRGAWDAQSGLKQRFLQFHHTLAGRLLAGPFFETPQVWVREVRRMLSGDRQLARWWAEFIFECICILAFVTVVLGQPWWFYPVAGYLGHSLGLVRSFAEHRWVEPDQTRSAVVRAGKFFSLLFLNNNLHDTHHAQPGVAWYALPALSIELASDTRAKAGAGLYNGYRDVARQFAFRPQDHPLFPPSRPLGPSTHEGLPPSTASPTLGNKTSRDHNNP